jgi:CRP-like cAMP-binding protein
MSSLPVVETPLFRDFTCEELVDVIRALELRVFAPGAIIVTEDEPGASLFVLTSGTVLAHVRDTNGRNARIRQLQEGDFFGEISLLKGGRRTATITAASHCELLEINREVFGTISQKHPRVWEVLKHFHDERAGSTLEAAARAGRELEGSRP